MLIKTLLNKVERFKSFIYGNSKLMTVGGSEALIVDIKPRRNSMPECPECGKRGKAYDTQPVRLFEYVPVWSFKVYLRYAPRRVCCLRHGIKVEALPWGYGKEQMTISYQVYLARWAKRLSWKETADIFKTSWDVYFGRSSLSSITALRTEASTASQRSALTRLPSSKARST